MKIRLAGLVEESSADGPGIRFVVFAQGCRHDCPGCHNPHTHAFEGGTLHEVDDLLAQMRANPLLDGITLSGGEPFEQAEGFAELAKKARERGYGVMTYTGYRYEELLDGMDVRDGWHYLLETTDLLVDGRYEEALKTGLLPFRGSANQRMIDVRRSLREKRICLFDD